MRMTYSLNIFGLYWLKTRSNSKCNFKEKGTLWKILENFSLLYITMSPNYDLICIFFEKSGWPEGLMKFDGVRLGKLVED